MTTDPVAALGPHDELTAVRSATVLPRVLRRRTRRNEAIDELAPIEPSGDLVESSEPPERTDSMYDDDEVFVRAFIPRQQTRGIGPFGVDQRWDVMLRPEFVERVAGRREAGEALVLVVIGMNGLDELSLGGGPDARDMALRNSHRILRWMLGPSKVAYFGADCFGVLLSYDETSADRIDSVLERLARTDLSDRLSGVFATASAGMVVLDESQISAEDAIYEAECTMLSAKGMGSARVVVADLPMTHAADMSF